MKRCPACNRVETEDTLTFCRVDGTPLVRESAAMGEGAGTLRLSPEGADTSETRILPTGEALDRPTAPTTVLKAPTGSSNTHGLSKSKSRRGFVIALAAVAVLALAASAYFFSSRGRAGADKNSVAVLPFQNAGGDPNMEYLSDGISESLINSLSQLPNVRVLARSTMFRFKGKDADPLAVGRQLGVDTVLMGKVVQVGDSLSVQADLVSVSDGSQLWGERYDRRPSDLVGLQREIARDVSNKLRLKLSAADEQKLAKNYTENAEAYKLYLQGRFHLNKRTAKDIRRSIEYFEQAIAVDPNYTLAYTGAADAYTVLRSYEGVSSSDIIPKAREAALKALSLDDQLAEAHISLGFVLLYHDYNFAGAEAQFKRAIELNPRQALGHYGYSNLLSSLGRHEESLAEIRLALELEPLSPLINRYYGIALFMSRRYGEAVAQLKKVIELDAGFVAAHDTLSNAYRLTGQHAESVEEYAKSQELLGNPKGAAFMRERFAKGGWHEYLRAITNDSQLNLLRARYIAATFHAELGEKDKAFVALNQAYEDREFFLIMLKVDPRLDPLRSDPRFQDLVLKVGFPQ